MRYFKFNLGVHVVLMAVTLAIATLKSSPTLAAPPNIQTPAPLIHLADNLDEQDDLGWCIDTIGRDFNERLHCHSCKPEGGDVQFNYNEDTLQIYSVAFPDYSIEMTGGPVEGMSLSLVESDPDSPDQQFIYSIETGEFSAVADSSLVLAAGETSSVAGIYMSRSLTLERSETTDVLLKQWVIQSTAVPEPAAYLTLLIGIITACHGRRRTR